MKLRRNGYTYTSILELIGNTPLVKLEKTMSYFKIDNELYAKLELFNPGGSVKDRIALYMIEGAKKEGLIADGAIIIEPTSGNTGIGLALVACVNDYLTVFVMPKKMSSEKENLLKALGAFVVRTPTEVPAENTLSYYRIAEIIRNIIWLMGRRISREELRKIVEYVQELVNNNREDILEKFLKLDVKPTPYAYIPNQYFNRYNPLAHYETTAREIWEQTNGQIDYVFSGIGTGGTITGIARFLKERNEKIKVIGIDPIGSIYHLLKKGMSVNEARKYSFSYKVEGIGEDILPGTVDLDLIDDIVVVSDQEAFAMTRFLARKEGILAGGSSGAALYGAIKYLKENSIHGRKVVIIFPDTGRNYLSKIFNDEWLRKNGFEIEFERILGDLI